MTAGTEPRLSGPVAIPRSSWDEISLLDLLTPVVREWKRILIYMLIAGAIAAGVSFLVRPKYSASTTLVPESSGSLPLPSGLTALAGQLGLAGGPATGSLSPDFLVAVLRSRSVLEPVLQTRFVPSTQSDTAAGRPLIDLMAIEQGPPNKRMALAMRALNAQVSTEINRRTGIIAVEVEQPDPRLAADVANALAAELNRFNLERRKSQSREQRIFTQERLKDAERELRRAEEAHQRFLQANRSYTESPVLFFESNRLQRGVQLKQEVFLTLSKSFEEASIAEVRDTPVLTLIDTAVQPFRRSSPNRKLYVMVAALAAGLLGAGLAIARGLRRSDGWRNRRDYQELSQAWQGAQGEVSSFLRRGERPE